MTPQTARYRARKKAIVPRLVVAAARQTSADEPSFKVRRWVWSPQREKSRWGASRSTMQLVLIQRLFRDKNPLPKLAQITVPGGYCGAMEARNGNSSTSDSNSTLMLTRIADPSLFRDGALHGAVLRPGEQGPAAACAFAIAAGFQAAFREELERDGEMADERHATLVASKHES